MKVNKLVNKRLLMSGLGTFSGLLLGIIARQPVGNIVGEWKDEATSGGLILLGSLLMGMKDNNMKKIGLGVGSVGVAVLGRSIFFRFTGQTTFDVSPGKGAELTPREPGEPGFQFPPINGDYVLV